MKIIITILLATFLLAACISADKVSPPQTSVAASTITSEPILTPSRSRTFVEEPDSFGHGSASREEPTLESEIEVSVTDASRPAPTATESMSLLKPNGPWLAYTRYGLSIVNQDGTGRTILEDPACIGGGIQENPLNRLVIFPGTVYLVQPEATWKLIYSEWPPCGTDFTGDEKGGLLASIYRSTPDALPELRIHELPSGKVRDQFSLFKCSGQCNTDIMGWWESRWSPNGRYLAFPAILDGQSTDLYVYDTENGSISRLTTGPDDVGTIWWSPDGSQIVMGEIHDNYYPYTSSLWSVSVSTRDIRLLYSREEDPYPQGLLGWLDDRRFIVYDGSSLADALALPAYNLRVVDLSSGEVTTLFNGSFMAAVLDAPHETVAFLTYDEEPKEGFAGSGLYLVSASHPRLRHLEGVNFLTWDADRALFVSDVPCEGNPTGVQEINYRGEWQCVYPELQPESLSSPDGAWQVVLQDGFWLKTSDQEPIQVSLETPTQIIWREDSKGLFFIANQILYYTSLPELDIKIVEQYPGGDSIPYQWVGGG